MQRNTQQCEDNNFFTSQVSLHAQEYPIKTLTIHFVDIYRRTLTFEQKVGSSRIVNIIFQNQWRIHIPHFEDIPQSYNNMENIILEKPQTQR